MTILLSAGHALNMPGVAANGYREELIALEFRNLVSTQLGNLGVAHKLDGNLRENLPLKTALTLAASSTLAVEFHTNAATPKASGVEALTWEGKGTKPKEIASLLAQTVAAQLGLSTRSWTPAYKGWKPDTSGQHSRLAFCRVGKCSIILELFFLTNVDDCRRYQLHKHAAALALATNLKQAELMLLGKI